MVQYKNCLFLQFVELIFHNKESSFSDFLRHLMFETLFSRDINFAIFRQISIEKLSCQKLDDVAFNLLSPNSDQNRISPHNIND